MKRTPATNRIFRVLRETGARKANVLLGMIGSEAEFERAVGQLFLLGAVQWYGKGRGRVLRAKSEIAGGA